MSKTESKTALSAVMSAAPVIFGKFATTLGDTRTKASKEKANAVTTLTNSIQDAIDVFEKRMADLNMWEDQNVRTQINITQTDIDLKASAGNGMIECLKEFRTPVKKEKDVANPTVEYTRFLACMASAGVTKQNFKSIVGVTFASIKRMTLGKRPAVKSSGTGYQNVLALACSKLNCTEDYIFTNIESAQALYARVSLGK